MNLKKPTPVIARHAPVRELLSAVLAVFVVIAVIAVIASAAKQSRMSRVRRAFPSRPFASFADKPLIQIFTPARCDGGLA